MKIYYYENIIFEKKIAFTGEKPFACSICEKAFYTKSLVKKHEEIHSKEKPFTKKVETNSSVTREQIISIQHNPKRNKIIGGMRAQQ